MKIQILTFGIARDITGADQIDMDLPEHASVDTLKNHLIENYPAMKRLRSLMVAVNAVYASPDTILTEKDEVALIPPVSGG
ncbi:MAG: molybdopterin converting factor subunit 1 [Bacteroidetes bacterium]|nr:MAG: molybdopterin converting factor subunit 1 [Bacteroidota bacterium]